MMPILATPLHGSAELRAHVETWPKADTRNEWIAIDGNRLICRWSWRGEGPEWPADLPTLHGVSTYEFNEAGLIQHYEDFFDPGWANGPALRLPAS